MKVYRNKLYSIEDAAKRAGIKEEDLKTMIRDNFITINDTYFATFIKGGDIPGLKKKWIKYQRIRNINKGGKNKILKKTKVTMLRMDKGD